MGMSPMPIREALRRLDSVGLVENIPHRGARVADLSVEDLKDVYDSRLMLEVSAIESAAENFSEEDAATAEDSLSRLERALTQVASRAQLRISRRSRGSDLRSSSIFDQIATPRALCRAVSH